MPRTWHTPNHPALQVIEDIERLQGAQSEIAIAPVFLRLPERIQAHASIRFQA